MKKLFALLLAATLLTAFSTISYNAQAQIVKELKPDAAGDTLTNAQTTYVYLSAGLGSNSAAQVEGEAISVRAKLTRLSGTAAGSVALEGNLGSGDWKQIATDNFTNVAAQVFDYSLRNAAGKLQYVQYRLVFITSGTVSAIPKAYYLRRNN